MSKQNDLNDLEINEYENNYSISVEEEIYQLDLKIQEIDILIERLEYELYSDVEEEFPYDEYRKLKLEAKSLRKQRRELTKQLKTKWDKFPVWMFVYGAFQIVFSFFYVQSMISLLFASWLWELLHPKIKITKFLELAPLFFIPFISLVISTIIFIALKDKIKKRFFLYIYIIQFLETILSVVMMISYISASWK